MNYRLANGGSSQSTTARDIETVLKICNPENQYKLMVFALLEAPVLVLIFPYFMQLLSTQVKRL
jgi:hypothetical protein